MGITDFSISLLNKIIERFDPFDVLEFGSQNVYSSAYPGMPFASVFYHGKGLAYYDCIDLAGDNEAIRADLSEDLSALITRRFSLVTDFGTSEHCVQMEGYDTAPFHDGHIHSIYPVDVKNAELGYYNCWLNKFNFCKVGGIIVSENPKQGHWPSHGYHYITQEFYEKLSDMADLEIVELGEYPAAGNWETGMNVYSVLRKTGGKFPSFDQFSTLPIKQS